MIVEAILHGQDPSGTPGLLNVATVDEEGNLRVNVNLSAEVEMVGEPVLNRRYTASASGNTTLFTAPAGNVIQIFRATLSVSQNITGEVILSTGSGNNLGGVWNPQSGGFYSLLGAAMDYEQTGVADSLILTLPSAISVTVNISYKLSTTVNT
jgi:hypothetical protein